MAENKPQAVKKQLREVRLSFPAIWKKAEFEGEQTKFEATFLVDKDAQSDQVDMINAEIDRFLEAKFGKGKIPKSVKRTCFLDGDEKDYDGYENHMAFKATSNKRFTIIDRDRSPLTEEDGKPEAGDYVNAIVSLWYSDHPKGGKQVLANLHGIQFVKEGERFGAETAADPDEFDAFDEEDDF